MVAKSPFVWTADVFPARGQNGGPGGALPSVERPTVKSSAPRGTPRFKYGLRQCSTNGAPSFAPRRYGAGRTRPQEKSAAPTCVEIKILRRVRAESSRRPPRHRRDACSMAWRCRFLAARPSQDGRVVAEKRLSEELSGAPDALVDFHTGGGPPTASTRSKLGKLRSGTGTRTEGLMMKRGSTAPWASSMGGASS